MSWQVLRRLSVPMLAAVAFVTSYGTASAVPLVFNGAPNSSPPFHNPGGPPTDVNSFGVDITIAPGSTLFVQGNVNFDIHVSANLGLTGATFSQGANVTLPAQNIPITSNT